MNIKFRRMTLDDTDEVFKLEQEVFDDSWSMDNFIEEINNTKISYPCVMLADDQLVAYAVAWYFSGELHISNFAVAEPFRGKGFAKKLMEHLLAKFSEHEIALLEVRSSNTSAIQLYKRFHFSELSIRPAYYADGEDALVMARTNPAVDRRII